MQWTKDEIASGNEAVLKYLADQDPRDRPTVREWTPADWLRYNAIPICREYYRRNFENALKLYKAQPAAREFHRCIRKRRLLVGSNQAGKTTGAVAETSRVVRGAHPLMPKRDGIMLCVGLDENHIGQNMWEKLTSPAFKVVPDEITGAPRAVRPDPKDPKHIDPIDLAREHLWKPAPPFLPPEEWDYPGGIAWDAKNKNVPAIVNIRSTGWKMLWHPSGGNPRRGITLHWAWMDEEIAKILWFTETMPRLLREGGMFVWSATPQSETEELLKLHRLVEDGDPDTAEFTLYLEDTPYIPDAEKKRFYNICKAFGDEVLQVRYFGKWGILGRQVYPDWDLRGKMGVDGFDARATA